MPSYGFGQQPFGEHPFGDVDYAKIVLWDELPPDLKDDDERVGSPYRTFVNAMAPNYQWIRNHIRRFQTIVDPRRIRIDLLEWFGQNFGIQIDLEEPEAYQRMRANLAARWNIIKGTVDSYTVLCRVHGFEVNVIPLWWDGTGYSEVQPRIYNEALTTTAVVAGGNTDYTLRFGCAPMALGSLSIVMPDATVLLDDVTGQFVGHPESTIDYGWGYATVTIAGIGHPATDARGSYDSVEGGCVENCVKCKTHRLRLQVTPGDIGGQNQLTISEAFQRLYKKLGEVSGNGVIPVHVELEQLKTEVSAVLSIGYHYDVLPADSYIGPNLVIDGMMEDPEGPELVIDGDMEAAGTTSWPDSGGGEVITKELGSPGGTGSRVLRITKSGVGVKWVYQHDVVAGKSYLLTGWARGNGTSNPYIGDNLNVFWNGTTSIIWQPVLAVFTAVNTNAPYLYMTGGGAGNWVEFDDISVAEMCPAWTAGNSAMLTKETTTPFEGFRNLRVASTVANNPFAQQLGIFTLGETYVVFGWVRSDGAALPAIYIGGVAPSWIGTRDVSWNLASFEAVADGNDFKLRCTVVGAGFCEFDKFIVVKKNDLLMDRGLRWQVL